MVSNSKFIREKRLAHTGDFWDIISQKWMMHFWHYVHMSWKSVGLSGKNNRRIQDGQTRLRLYPWLILRPHLPMDGKKLRCTIFPGEILVQLKYQISHKWKNHDNSISEYLITFIMSSPALDLLSHPYHKHNNLVRIKYQLQSTFQKNLNHNCSP